MNTKSVTNMDKAKSKAPAKTDFGKLGVKLTGGGMQQNIEIGDDDALKTIFGTEYSEMAVALVTHCLKVLSPIESSDEHEGNDERMFMVAAVAEIEPRDAVERMLAVQMATTHVALVRSAGMLAKAQNLNQLNAHSNGYNKLARTYAAQVEALRKHRNGGKQTVTVQHVNVADGGQAIVGNVETGGRVSDGK